ncbi:MAG: lysophospholipid acyltransferase family protein [Acidobacteriota bacterium]
MRALVHGLIRFLLLVVFGARAGDPVEEEQAIVVGNHDTHLDVFLLFSLFPLRRVGTVRAVAAEDYFGRGLRGLLARGLFRTLLIPRGSGDPQRALEPVRQALRRGESLVVFPEGTRGEPGVLLPFKSGIGVLMEEFPGVPVYPVALRGVERTLPKGGAVPVPFVVEMVRLPRVTGEEMVAKYGPSCRKAIAAELHDRIAAALAGAGEAGAVTGEGGG